MRMLNQDTARAIVAAISPANDAQQPSQALTFDAFRAANVARCLKWHPEGLESWSPSDWLTAVTGELGELASLLKMRNRERDGQGSYDQWKAVAGHYEGGDVFRVQCDHCDGTGKVDDYGNPLSGDRTIYCCFPDCGCDGARLCMAEKGASVGACSLNIERGSLKA